MDVWYAGGRTSVVEDMCFAYFVFTLLRDCAYGNCEFTCVRRWDIIRLAFPSLFPLPSFVRTERRRRHPPSIPARRDEHTTRHWRTFVCDAAAEEIQGSVVRELRAVSGIPVPTGWRREWGWNFSLAINCLRRRKIGAWKVKSDSQRVITRILAFYRYRRSFLSAPLRHQSYKFFEIRNTTETIIFPKLFRLIYCATAFVCPNVHLLLLFDCIHN